MLTLLELDGYWKRVDNDGIELPVVNRASVNETLCSDAAKKIRL
jgi:hypothetical protein